MPRIEFFQQKRADGGVRTGVGVYGEITVSAIRSLREGELAKQLTSLARRWRSTIDSLMPFAGV